MNLLIETLECLKELNINKDDIYGVYDGKTLLNWNDFKELAFKVNYDNGYGSQEINESLLIYTKKAILYRHEYDGAECWKYIPVLNKEDLLSPKEIQQIKPLFHDKIFNNERFILQNSYEYLSETGEEDSLIWRIDYEELLDYKGGYIR